MGKPLFDFEDAFDIFTPFIVLLIAFFSAKFLRIARLRLRLWRLNRRHARQEVNSGRATDGLVRLTDVTTTAPVTARPEPPRLQVRREWTPASPEVPTAPRRPAAGATAARDRRLSRLKEYAYDASAEQADGDECTICFEDFSGGERIRELPCGTIGHRASRGRRTRPHFTASFSDLRTVLSFSLSLWRCRPHVPRGLCGRVAPSARVVSNLQERRLRAAAGPSGDLGRVPRGEGGQGGSRGGRGGHVVLIAKSATAILWRWRVAIAVENIDVAVVGSHGAERARPASHSWR